MRYKHYISGIALLIVVSLTVSAQEQVSASFGSPSSHFDSTKMVTNNAGVIKVTHMADTDLAMLTGPDTALAQQLTIKINPGLLFNEQGLMLQYNFKNNFGIELGYGYNEDYSGNPGFHTFDGTGSTYRAGLIQYLDAPKKWYFKFSGFYRYYHELHVVAQDAEGFTQGIDDEVVNPLRSNLAVVSAGDGNQVDAYTAKVRVICFDAIMGYQYRHKHFVLDVFGGLGERSKYINLREIGYYTNVIGTTNETMISYHSVMSKSVSYSYLDAKLGFTVGYRIF